MNNLTIYQLEMTNYTICEKFNKGENGKNW
nr:MAG TPA: hypothetical protein [Caudoviricetes sp.]